LFTSVLLLDSLIIVLISAVYTHADDGKFGLVMDRTFGVSMGFKLHRQQLLNLLTAA